MRVHTLPMGPLSTNAFLLENDTEAVAVDPGGDVAPILELLNQGGLTLTHVLNTHLHFDHIYGNRALAEATGAVILANPEDEFLLETELGGGGFMGLPKVEIFSYQPLKPGRTTFIGRTCDVLATPGHTPGSLSFSFPDDGVVLVGDLIFHRSIGRTDFPGGDLEQLKHSVETAIFTLPDETVIHAGHGEATTVGDEKRNNPFFSPYGL